MIRYTMGEDAVSGADVVVDENNGLLYNCKEPQKSKSGVAKKEPKRKSFREFFEERVGFAPEIGCKGETYHATICRLMVEVADYMDYISGSEPEPKEPEPNTCLKCKHFVDENGTGFYAMGCKRDGAIIPTTAELDMSKSDCFEAKE